MTHSSILTHNTITAIKEASCRYTKMSTKTDNINRAFRTVDVDLYNEDNYQEELDNEETSTSLDTNEINSLLNSNKGVEALKLFLASSPTGLKDESSKKSTRELAVRIMMAVRVAQIEEAVAQLDKDSLDVLMKFIYAGFESPNEGSSAHLLAWHEKVFSSTGVGAIVRVLADKRRA